VKGILPEGLVTISDVRWVGTVAVEVTSKDSAGRLGNELLYRDREPTLEIAEAGRPWSFDGDAGLFRLLSEARLSSFRRMPPSPLSHPREDFCTMPPKKTKQLVVSWDDWKGRHAKGADGAGGRQRMKALKGYAPDLFEKLEAGGLSPREARREVAERRRALAEEFRGRRRDRTVRPRLGPNFELPAFEARYRFFFNPIRYTSLGLAVCEAMMVGIPILGLATTEMVTAVQNGVSGYLETDVGRLIGHMKRLLADPAEARRLGDGARQRARERFAIGRFVRDWDQTFALVAGTPSAAVSLGELGRVGGAA
jgi:hypothetical protein